MLVSCHHHDHRKQLKRERMYVGTSFQKASVHPRGESFVVEIRSGVCLHLCGPESNKRSRNQGPGLTLKTYAL